MVTPRQLCKMELRIQSRDAAMKNLLGVCFVVLWCPGSALHGRDNTVCTPPQAPTAGPTRPQIPSVYTVNTECNILDKNHTVNAQEWSDGPNNRAKMITKKEGKTTIEYFNYNTNEILSVTLSGSPNPPPCRVQNLSTSVNRVLFGLQMLRNGSEHLYEQGSAFEFGGNVSERYLGQEVIRGIRVDAWRSCLYFKKVDVTASVTWYFTANGAWTSASNVSQVPVRCHATGRMYTNQAAPFNFDHIYEFSSFSPTVDNRVFEVPPMTVCLGRKNTKQLPKQSKQYFKMKSEIVSQNTNDISFMWEWYDFTTKVSRFVYRPTPSMRSPYGTTFITEIHDYNTGLSFVMDNVRGNCSVDPITTLYDAARVDAHHVRMQSIQDFYKTDPGSLAYEGVKTVRGIDCDVWVSRRDDWPTPGMGINSTWEWYTATGDWLTAHGFSSQYNLPVMAAIAAPSINYYGTFNVYDYDEDEPSLLNVDTTPCFGPSQKKDVKFILPAEYKQYVTDELSMFRYFVMVTVSGYTSISPTRINNIKIDYLDTEDLLISLRMLDVPPITGDIVNPQYQLPLQEAVNILTFGINTGNFTIDINGVSMRAKPYSVTSKDTVIEEHPWKNRKLEYTGGSVVGLGVGMLLISFILGFVIYLIIKKRRNASKS